MRDYKDFVEQLGEQDRTADRYHLTSASSAFSAGNKTFHSRNAAGEFALPLMRQTMELAIECKFVASLVTFLLKD